MPPVDPPGGGVAKLQNPLNFSAQGHLGLVSGREECNEKSASLGWDEVDQASC